MWTSILDTLGVDPVLREHWSHVRLGFLHPEILWLALFLVPIAGWFVIRRHAASIGTISTKTRWLLSVLRICVFALVLLILATPFLSLDAELEQKPLVVFAVDQSRSMDLPLGKLTTEELQQVLEATEDQSRDATAVETKKRIDIAHQTLNTAMKKIIAVLAEKYDVSVISVGGEVAPLLDDVTKPDARLPDPPKTLAGRSRLGDAIAQLADEAVARPIAGIVLLSDGQNTSGSSLMQSAYSARRNKSPVFGVPVGGDARIKDIAIADFFAPGMASQGDSPRLSTTIVSHGYDGQNVDIVLKEGDQVLERKPLVLTSSEQQHLDFTYLADRLGLHVLTVEIEAKDDEAIRVNNRVRTSLRVSDEKLQILMVEGQPRWDFRFLRNAMSADRGVELQIVLETEISNKNTVPLLGETPEAYDNIAAVILGDASLELMTPTRQKALLTAVRDRGLGLIIAAGPRAMPHQYRGQPIEPLIPVVIETSPGQNAPSYEPFRLSITPAGKLHEVVRIFDDEARNERLWETLPEFYWCSAASRPKPGATVLLANEKFSNEFGKAPIVAVQQAGEGSVLYVGDDTTSRWRENVGDRYFYKFWGQAMRYVARRTNERSRNRIEVNPQQISPGEEATIVVTGPLDQQSVQVAVSKTSSVDSNTSTTKEEHQLTLMRDEDSRVHRYSGRIKMNNEGRFLASLVDAQAEAEFAVVEGSQEFQHPEVNREALDAASQASGGRLLELNELGQLKDLLSAETSVRRLRHQQDLWDRWFTLLLVASLYCLDVGIRRWIGIF